MQDDEKLLVFLQTATKEELLTLLDNIKDGTYMHKMLIEKIDSLIQ